MQVEKLETHTIISEIAIHIQNGFLNGRGTINGTTITAIKSFSHPKYGELPYVSAQALRKWIRENFISYIPNNNIPGYYDRVQNTGKKTKKTIPLTNVDPVKSIEDDVFGYTHPMPNHKEIIMQNKNKTRPNVVSLNRHAPLKTSILSPIPQTASIHHDSGYVHLPNDTPLPYSNQFVNTYYTYTSTLELHRIGVYNNIADLIEIDETLIQTYQKKQVLIKNPLKAENAEQYQLTEPELIKRRLQVTEIYLKTILTLTGGAKTAQFLSDLTPKAIILILQKSANPRFMGIYESNIGKLTINVNELIKRIEEGVRNKDFLTNVYIGTRTNNVENIKELTYTLKQHKELPVKIGSIGDVIHKFLEEVKGYYKKFEE